jgi:glycosyltransferase involved in cell wall biosynthesis
MNILFVVQRYGHDIVGGAELHCRLVAEHLSQFHHVEIATTCASDYLTWKNVYPTGSVKEKNITIHRFANECQRPDNFDQIAFDTLHGNPSFREQEDYIRYQGPYCPDLIAFLQTRSDVDRFIFFSYRYWITCEGLKFVGNKSILVPTAEHDRTLYLPCHRNSFHRASVIAYNSIEERDLIHRITGNGHIPGDVVGVGLPDELSTDSRAVQQKFDLFHSYVVYIGRIEQSKGCPTLIQNYLNSFTVIPEIPELVLIGKQEISVPDHSRLRSLGILQEDEKTGVLQGALCLMMPSQFESLSMVVLEAWRCRKPVFCNGNCEVLRGQCLRSNGGLYYRNADEFVAGLELLVKRADLRTVLGGNGYLYYQQNYSWDIIMQKYQQMLGAEPEKTNL